MSERLPLLLEIGTEELPPAFLAPTVAELERRLREHLAAAGLAPGPARTFATPRRLAVLFESVAPERPGREVELQGPPRRAAFDAEGRPTRTAEGFSRANSRTVADLYVKDTPRGEYVFLRRAEPPVRAAELLATGLPALIAGLPFPRSMRWRGDRTRFARPVRRLVCLLGSDPVPFSFAGLTADRLTDAGRGAGGPLELESALAYEPRLADRGVVADPERRRALLVEAVTRLAAEVGGEPVLDPELLEETVAITESPVALRCRLDPAHLGLPAPVLVTALKMHQRCFAVSRPGKPDELLPCFVGVADTPGCDTGSVGRWLERAVESRLRDARFFHEADIKRPLAELVEEERRVTWFEGMGSYHDKTTRLRALCRLLGTQVGGVDPALLDRAAELAKADLLTNMVREKEFTSLQGRIGGIYARLQGEPAEVADAISEQYLPAAAGDRLPATRAGALLGIADKTDNIVAGFLAGRVPTGSEDPFALRRQAAGIFTVILEHRLPVDLARLRETAVGLLAAFSNRSPELLPGFFIERATQALADRGVPYDVADAVLAAHPDLPLAALAAARALVAFRERPGFEPLIVGQKRVANILRGQDVTGPPDPARFAADAERGLWQQAGERARRIEELAREHDYGPALETLLELRPAIDQLFDDVLVMDKDETVRANRLRLLLAVRDLFRRVADLSRIVIEGDAGGQ
ncbi:MAG: glycine--tRNA ligase subunit beta [bacterium]